MQEINVPVYNKINLSIKEAAAYSNVGENTIRRLLAERGCPFLLKIGNRQLVKRKEFENFLEVRHFFVITKGRQAFIERYIDGYKSLPKLRR